MIIGTMGMHPLAWLCSRSTVLSIVPVEGRNSPPGQVYVVTERGCVVDPNSSSIHDGNGNVLQTACRRKIRIEPRVPVFAICDVQRLLDAHVRSAGAQGQLTPSRLDEWCTAQSKPRSTRRSAASMSLRRSKTRQSALTIEKCKGYIKMSTTSALQVLSRCVEHSTLQCLFNSSKPLHAGNTRVRALLLQQRNSFLRIMLCVMTQCKVSSFRSISMFHGKQDRLKIRSKHLSKMKSQVASPPPVRHQ